MAENSQLYEALSKLRDLGPANRERLVRAVEAAPPKMSVSELATYVSHATAFDQQFLFHVLSWVGDFAGQALSDPNWASGFGKAVAEWLMSNLSKVPAEVASAGLEEHLRRLLSAERSIGVTSKAQRVAWSHGKVFREAHLTTQIRPIFFRNLETKPENAVLMHDLRLDYREDGQDRSICISLDLAQVSELKGVLDRAIEKEQRLRKDPSFSYLPNRG